MTNVQKQRQMRISEAEVLNHLRSNQVTDVIMFPQSWYLALERLLKAGTVEVDGPYYVARKQARPVTRVVHA